MRRLLAVSLVMAAVALASCSSSKGGGGQAGGNGCAAVDVASSPEKFELLTQLAKGFNDDSAAQKGGCATVKVENKSSGAAADLLASGWQDEAANGCPLHLAGHVPDAAPSNGRRTRPAQYGETVWPDSQADRGPTERMSDRHRWR